MSLFSRTKIDDQPDTSTSNSTIGNAAITPCRSERTDARSSAESEAAAAAQLQVLGLLPGATSEEIAVAHARLVSDLTPGAGATHRNVALAEQFLREVNQAFDALRMQSVA